MKKMPENSSKQKEKYSKPCKRMAGGESTAHRHVD